VGEALPHSYLKVTITMVLFMRFINIVQRSSIDCLLSLFFLVEEFAGSSFHLFVNNL
jgi:hypothetical protein